MKVAFITLPVVSLSIFFSFYLAFSFYDVY